jgi:hypothetical protein
MATVLNLIMTGVTVFMVVDEEEVFESANNNGLPLLFSFGDALPSPSPIKTQLSPYWNISFAVSVGGFIFETVCKHTYEIINLTFVHYRKTIIVE